MDIRRKERMPVNLAGLVLIVVGVIIAGNVLDWWDISLFFRGWWTLFIIIPCGQSVMKRGFQSGAGFGLVVGILLFLSQQNLFSFGWIVKLAIPVLLIYYGLKIVSQGHRVHIGHPESMSGEYRGEAGCNAIFSGKEQRVNGEEYFGSAVNAVFGGAELDLREAVIIEDVTINAAAIFGGVEIYLPKDVNVKVKASSLFGGTDNNADRPTVPEWPTVYIYTTSIFGGVEIQ